MKKLFLFLVLSLGFAIFAQDELPSNINEAFTKKYKNASNINWIINEENYAIDFDMEGNSFTTIFSSSGNWIETSMIISNMDIPSEVTTTINDQYPESGISYAETVENISEKYYRVYVYTEELDYIINLTSDGEIISVDKQ